MSLSAPTLPVEHTDEINTRILEVSEDQIKGFHRHPFQFVAKQTGLSLETVLERVQGMLKAGVIRRVRQTLLANKLADGGLVAWNIDNDKLDAAFDFMFKQDPFSGHVVLRSTDRDVSGSDFKLWTTVKVPVGKQISEHCDVLQRLVGAKEYIIMQPKGIFALGVGHVRRKTMELGDKAEVPAEMITPDIVELSPLEWEVLVAMKRDFAPDEIVAEPWVGRAAEIGISVEKFCEVAQGFDDKGILGRFSTFLEHVKPSQSGVRVTRFNALFHWRVEEGMQQRAGSEVGRHHIMTHAYWREGGPRFANANIMGVVHGTDRARVLEHKAAIDQHLENIGIPVLYTNVFWGGRSEIKPSEISPKVFAEWHEKWKDAGLVI
ncbi:Lrp/AsnC family transcriptional regulator [Phragmitibacter flavus]|uniref:Lrp/AsnC family transcriptional regulator n=1 Tax=Phragmitibacter flavus TaxID=2576071 RepID=A0A5R8KFH5_9BACT|nr:Lrp/AsnC family transcriptional regulator [Phragmitibacter flavus]TLD71048.1 Lrp/AsnC family transcriptional regulator [Phragmitibacter flavus]